MHEEHQQQPTPALSQGPRHPLQSFTPMQTFLIGGVGGVMALCTVGFFVLLSMFLGSSASFDGGLAADVPARVAGAGAEVPSPSAPVGDISVRAVDEKTDHIRGAKNAKVSIVEFSDFDCPFCQRFHTSMKTIVEKYSDEVQWVYRHFPLDQLHPEARTKALASECAGEQGKFWEFADIIFERSETASDLPDIAKELGLNTSKFQTCLDDKKFAKNVQEDEQDGAGSGARGTPYSVIVGADGAVAPLSGAQPVSAIEAALQPFL